MGPEQTGEAIGSYLQDHSGLIDNYSTVKGFLNLEINDPTWLNVFHTLFHEPDPQGHMDGQNEHVVVEFSSPNTNKPLHLGHLRNIFLGDSVSRILMATGASVHRVQIINDRGIHICKSMLAWLKYGKGETPDSAGLKGDRLVGKYYILFDKNYRLQVQELIDRGKSQKEAEKEASLMVEAQEMLRKWEEKDPEVIRLWTKMNSWVYQGFEKTYGTIGIRFDKAYYESETYELGKAEVEKGVDQEIFYPKKDGSVWVDLTNDGLDEKILLRADGTSVYMTQDIGTAILRYRDFPAMKSSIYTVGNEQEYHFKVLFLILKKLGFEWADQCYHLSYGMVDLPSGKMKSREGTVVDADDIIKEMTDTAEKHTKELGKIDDFSSEQARGLYRKLALGALKYFLLKVDPQKRMLFDPEESIQFHGNTGPFVQYTYARVSAILRRATQLRIDPFEGSFPEGSQLCESERNLIYLLSQFGYKIIEAGTTLSPSVIALYVYDLAKEYNRFYAEVPVFKEELAQIISFRVALSDLVARTIAKAMGLLGIDVPERM